MAKVCIDIPEFIKGDGTKVKKHRRCFDKKPQTKDQKLKSERIKAEIRLRLERSDLDDTLKDVSFRKRDEIINKIKQANPDKFVTDDLTQSFLDAQKEEKAKRAERAELAAQKVKEEAEQRGQVSIGNPDYRGHHTAPIKRGKNSLDDMSDVYPDDIYNPSVSHRYYGHGSPEMDKESADIIAQYKGKPNDDVTIYRAVPKGVSQINNGDWITLSKTYADDHGYSYLGDDYEILEKTVKAKEVVTNGDSMHEFGYAADAQVVNQIDTESYPIEDEGLWHSDGNYKEAGGVIEYVTPDEFLAKAKHLPLDDDFADLTRENIDLLKDHISNGGKLDPLALYGLDRSNVRNSDGRHRAHAAKELGISHVPVINFTGEPISSNTAPISDSSEDEAIESEGIIEEFVPAKKASEGIQYAHENGVTWMDKKGLSLDQINAVNSFLRLVPQDAIPDVIGSSQTYNDYFGLKLKRKIKDFYGVSIESSFRYPIDAEDNFKNRIHKPRFGEDKILKSLGGDRFSTVENSQGIFFSKAYKSPSDIAARKKIVNDSYQERHGVNAFLNEEGESTYIHEMGHVFDKRRGKISNRQEWKSLHSRWIREDKTWSIKTSNEGFAEAFADFYLTGGSKLPDYILEYLKETLNAN